MDKTSVFKEVANKNLTVEEAMQIITDEKNGTKLSMWTYEYLDHYVKDHQVFDKTVLLGVTYCSIALDSYFLNISAECPICLQNFLFIKPIIFESGDKIELKVQNAEEDYRANSIMAYKNNFNVGELVAKYNVSLPKIKVLEDGFQKEAFLKSSQITISGEDIYRKMSQMKIKFGSSLKTVDRIWVKENECLCELSKKDSSDIKYNLLSPHFMDGAIVGAMAPFLDKEGDTYIPMYIGELIYYGKENAELYSHSIVKKNNTEVVVLDIKIYTAEGSLLLCMNDITMKRVEKSTIEISSNLENNESHMESTHIKNKESGELNFETKVIDYLKKSILPLNKDVAMPIDIMRNFMDLGIESNKLIELVTIIEKDLDLELYPTLFFEYQNIHDLSVYLIQNHRKALEQFMDKKNSQQIYDNKNSKGQKQILIKNETLLKDKGSTSMDIAVIGMDGVFAKSANLDEFWENIISGENLIEEIPEDHFDYKSWYSSDLEEKDKMYTKWGSFLKDVDKFDSEFFRISAREAETMDPQLRMLLQSLYHTAESAGVIRNLRGSKTGMFVGACFQDYSLELNRLGKSVEPYDGSGNAQTMYSNRPSFFFDLKGPSVSIDTACSSSLVAMHLACQSLRNKECEMAFVAGINLLLSSWHYRYFCSINALSPSGRCHTFDSKADGYIPGEGIASLLLKPLNKALADGDYIHGVIKGSAINHGGYTPSITAPSMKMEAQVMIDAWEASGIDPSTLGYIEAHGTGTKIGDPIEINAMKKAFQNYTQGKEFCAIGSAKAHIGHTEGAAGIAGVLKVLLSMKNKTIPAMPFFEELNALANINETPMFINKKNIPWENNKIIPRRAGVSSFGFGGAYAHMVLEEYVMEKDNESEEKEYLIVLSAKNSSALKRIAIDLKKYLLKKNNQEKRIQDIAFTLIEGREEYEKRLSIIAYSTSDLINKIDIFLENVISNPNIATNINTKNHEEDPLLQETIEDYEDLNKLALLWVNGGHVDWERLHIKGRLIELPGYSFEKNRYWAIVEKNDTNISRLHMLIDSNKSTLYELKYKKTLSLADKFLRDHSIYDKNILPGVVSLEMVRTAAEMAGQDEFVYQILDLEWNSPITLEADKIDLYVKLEEENKQVYANVFSENSQNRINHVCGKVIYTNSKAEREEKPVDINALKINTDYIMSGNDCYQKLQELGLHIGPSLQTIQQLYISKNEILAELNIKSDEDENFYANPAILDGAIQSVIGFSFGHADSLYVPFAIRKITYIKKLNHVAYAYIQLNENIMSGNKDKRLDITLMNENGMKCIQLSGLEMRQINTIYKQDEIVPFVEKWEEININNEQINPDGNVVIMAKCNSDLLYSKVINILNKSGLDVTYLPLNTTIKTSFEKILDEEYKSFIYLDDEINTEIINQKCVQYMESSFLTIFSIVKMMIVRKCKTQFIYISSSFISASIEAFLKTAKKEASFFRYKVIELLPQALEDKGLVNLFSADYNMHVQFNGLKYYKKSLIPYDKNGKDSIFEDDKTYLVTGGLGRIGVLLAEYLLKKYSCNLILVGRSELNIENEKVINNLRRINGCSAVAYYSCDISNQESLQDMLVLAREEFHQINGILHLAGIIDDKLIVNKKTESISKILSPKLMGTFLLGQLLQTEPLDFYILFSSISSLNGNSGQGDYAYANAFLRGYAEERSKLVEQGICTGKTLCICWPYWENGGMKMSFTDIQELEKIYGLKPLVSYEAFKFLEYIDFSASSIIALHGNRTKIQQVIEEKEKADKNNVIDEELDEKKQPDHHEDAVLLNNLESQLIKMFAELQRMESNNVKATGSLSGYGLESISITEFTKNISKKFNIQFLPSIFFEVDSIRDLSKLLFSQYYKNIIDYYRPELRKKTIVEMDKKDKSVIMEILPDKTDCRISNDHSISHGDIAIIGISGIMPSTENLEDFWKALIEGKNLISVIPPERWDWEKYYGNPRKEVNKTNIKWGGFLNNVDEFDAEFFGISPREAELMDPQQRIFLRVVWEAIENAGYKASSLRGTKTGVFVGVGNFDYSDLIKENGIPIEPYASTGIAHSILANRISYFFNLKGPSEAIDTACSSSLVSIHHAITSINEGYCDLAIAGGINLILNPNMTISFSKAGMLSEDGCCRSFDKDANGYVRGEGAGAIILKPLSKAIEDGDYIYAKILSSSINHGGKVNSLTVPNPKAQAEVIRDALKRAGINANSISYIEAHGTSTPLGDPIEIQGLKYAFSSDLNLEKENKSFCGVGSVKTNIGHLETAAGIASVLKVVLALQYKQLPATINFKELNPNIILTDTPFYINKELKEWEPIRDEYNEPIPRRAGVSSFGFGGTNAHIIIEEFENIYNITRDPQEMQLIILSADTEEQLRIYVQRLRDSIDSLCIYRKERNSTLELVAYTLQMGREERKYRLAVLVNDIDELKEKLTNFLKGNMDDEKVSFQEACNMDLFIWEWQEANEIINQVINKRDLYKLAKLWLNGAAIDWSLLYDNGNIKKIPLPTYPFKKTKYWLPEIINNPVIKQSLCPVIDTNISTIKGISFIKKLSKRDFFIHDHIINGVPVLPGVVYLEMAIQSLALSDKENEFIKIENIVWLKPIEVQNESKDVFMKVNRKKIQYAVCIQELFDTNERNFQCNIPNKINRTVDATDESIDSILNRCNQKYSNEDFYYSLKENGLELGSSLNAITDINYGDYEALIKYELPVEQNKNFHEYKLHPSILDAAITSPRCIMGDNDEKLYIPYAIESLDIVAPVSDKGYIHTTLSNAKGEKGVYKFNISILDENGNVSIKLNNFLPRPYTRLHKLTYYQNSWIKNSEVKSATENESKTLLAFVSNIEEYDVIRNESKKLKGVKVIGVIPGEKFKQLSSGLFQLDIECIEDYEILINRLINVEYLCILHAAFYKQRFSAEFGNIIEKHLKPLFNLFKSVLKNIKLFSNVTCRIICNNTAENSPLNYALGGFLHTLTKESIKINCVPIYMDARYQVEKGLKIGLIELFDYSQNTREVKHEEGEQYHRIINEINLEENRSEIFTIKPNGNYLITGGLGRIGYTFAKYIASKGANLILVGRSEPNEEKVKMLHTLKQYNVSVRYILCDFSCQENVEHLIKEIETSGDTLNGVIHAVGVIDDRYIIDKTYLDMQNVICPKALGGLWLDEETKDHNLDFFILFSSLVGTIGNPGQSDYAYANAFLNGLAEYRNILALTDKRKGKSISISWPIWKNGGMVLSDNLQKTLTQQWGIEPLTDKEGVEILENLFAFSNSNVIPIKGEKDLFMKKANYIINNSPKPQKEIESSDKFYEALKIIISNTIKTDTEIEPNKDLSTYGFDSITYTELAEKINERFNMEITPALFFEFPTIQSIYKFFIDNHQNIIKAFNDENHEDMTLDYSLDMMIDEFEDSIIQTNENKSFDEEPIAIIGLSCVMPMSKDADEFWDNLKAGNDLIQEVPIDRWDWHEYYGDPQKEENKTKAKWGGFIHDVWSFDNKFFKISPKEAALMDPQHRMFLQTVWKTIEDAGIKVSDLYGTKTALYVGISGWDYNEVLKESSSKVESLSVIGIAHSVLPNRISYLMDWHGPSEPVDTACSSSLVALHKAVEQLQMKKCDYAVAGGVNLILTPSVNISFDKAGMLSPDGRCKTFDKNANGYVRGEGVGAVLLKPLSKAIKDKNHIYGVIRGSAINHGGHVNSFTVPNPNAQADVIYQSLMNSKVSASTISYIETHGTGTSLGDPIEISGLKNAFSRDICEGNYDEQFCGLGTVKTNIGHLESAAGIAAVIKVLLSLKNNIIPSSIHFEELNPYIKLVGTPFYIVDKAKDWVRQIDENGNVIPRRAGVSSFGFGGVNAHVIIEEYDYREKRSAVDNLPNILILSARDEDGLIRNAENLKQWMLKNKSYANLQDIMYTLQTGREEMEYRLSVVGDSIEEFIILLNHFINKEIHPDIITGKIKNKNGSSSNRNEQAIILEQGLKSIKREELLNIAHTWCNGSKYIWENLYLLVDVKRISLPTYSFAKTIYRVDKENRYISTLKKTNNIPIECELKNYMYTTNWEYDIRQPEISIDSPILVIGNKNSDKLVKAIEESQKEVSVYSVEHINYNSQELIPILEKVEHIYFLGGIQPPEESMENETFLNRTIEEGILSLFRLFEMLELAGSFSRQIKLTVLTNNVYKIEADDRIQPAGGTLFGFLNSAMKEYSNLKGKVIDLSWEDIENNAKKLVDKLFGYRNGNQLEALAVRGETQYKRNICPIKLSQIENSTFRRNGTYLIIGGNGGIGSELASYLAKFYKANIGIVGRSKLDSKTQNYISEIEEMGGEALYISVDCGDFEQMSYAVNVIEKRFGIINGVIHSAVVLDNKLIKNMDESNITKVLWPKLNGSIGLYKALAGKHLDFMLFFSSLQSFSGMEGQSNYSAACTFQDSFSAYIATKEEWNVKTINWGFWGDVGVVSGEMYTKRMKKYGILSINVDEGIESIERVLCNPVESILVLKCEKSLLAKLKVRSDLEYYVYPDNLPNTEILFDKNEDIRNSLGESVSYDELEKYGQTRLLRIFQGEGLLRRKGEKWYREDFKKKLRVTERFERLEDELIRILVRGEYLAEAGETWLTTKKVETDEVDVNEKRKELKEKFPNTIPYLHLLDECMNSYLAILRGEIEATNIIFPDGNMDLVGEIYKDTPLSIYYNRQLSEWIKKYIDSLYLYGRRSIKILEIGAGTGGTSLSIFEAIKQYGDSISYDYTDISDGFVRYGRTTFGKRYPFVNFKVLDIENEQKYFGEYDLVIGANVLHATLDIESTLCNVKKLMTNGAALVLNEMVEKNDYTTLTFGLLDGWWRYKDSQNRIEGSPLLNEYMWKKQLLHKGFKKILLHNEGTFNDFPQDIIVAYSDGIVISETEITDKNDMEIPHKMQAEEKVVKYTAVNTNIREYVEKAVFDCLANVLSIGEDDFDKETPFVEFGIDSILSTEFVRVLNELLKTDLRSTELYNSSCINSLVDKIIIDYQSDIEKVPDIVKIIGEKEKTAAICESNIETSISNGVKENELLVSLTKLYEGEIGIEEFNMKGE